ncbi:hypothetical protein RAM80_27755 [Pseudomonas sp. App30]|uniref:hypothetical protein n=1 Tax=Pseudomonas sp. App30 TaxID=3068990 RepID=UPI003A812AC3
MTTETYSGGQDPLFSVGNGDILPHVAYGATFDNAVDDKRIYVTGQWSYPDYFYVAEHYDYGTPTGREYYSQVPTGSSASGLALFMQGDGIVVLGALTLPGRQGYFPFMSKVTRQLQLVPTFGNPATPGYAILGPESGLEGLETLDQLTARVTPRGIYILAGGEGARPNRLISLDLQGRLDTAFNGSGVLAITGQANHDLHLRALEVPEPYDRLIVAGDETAAGAARATGVFAGVTLAGVLDQGFGAGGFVRHAIPQASAAVSGSLLKHQLKWAVVGLGKALSDTQHSSLLISVNQDGSNDTDLNQGEPLLLEDGLGDLTWLHGAQDPISGVIVAGVRHNPANAAQTWPAFGRIGANGALDPTFGEGGVVTVRDVGFNPNTNKVQAMFVATANRLVVTGFASRSGTKSFMRGYLLR